MNERTNPYAPSAATLQSGEVRPTSGLCRDGKVLLIPHDGGLPERCVKCNADAVEPAKERTVYWHHPGYYVLLLVNVILYVIVAMIARKTAKVSPGLCEGHKKRRTLGILLGWGGLLLGLVLAAGAGAADHVGLVLLVVLLTLAAIIAGIVISRIVYASRIDDRYIRLKGCGEEFLATFPEFRPGTRDM